MNKKLVLFLSIIIVVVTFILISLLNLADPNASKNNFVRKFIDHPLKSLADKNLKARTFTVNGSTNSHLFLGGRDPRNILMVSFDLNNQQLITLNMPLSEIAITAHDVVVDSPKLDIYANNLSAIISYNILKGKIDTTKLPCNIFTRSVPITNNCIVIRTFDKTQKKQVFKKVNIKTSKILSEQPLIDNQNDGGFSTDGMLKYDNLTHRIFFTQYYQNKFYCMDTNLNLIYQAKTIDNRNINSIHAKQFISGEKGSIIPSVPLLVTNERTFVYNGLLFVLSGLKADNEKNYNFLNNAVIDVYQEMDGKYLGSMYIPTYKGEKIKDFFVSKEFLYATYTNKISLFSLPTTLLNSLH